MPASPRSDVWARPRRGAGIGLRARLSAAAAALITLGPAIAPGQPTDDPAPQPPPDVEVESETEAAPVVVLETARNDYEAARYGACGQALADLFDKKRFDSTVNASVRDDARHYAFACLLLDGKPKQAAEQARAAILANPTIDNPEPLIFRPNVVQRWVEIRISLKRELDDIEAKRLERERERQRQLAARAAARQDRIRRLQLIASTESVIEKNDRWVGYVPFGVGQFQNGQRGLGWTFLVAEGVLGGAFLTAMAIELSIHHSVTEKRAAGESPDEASANANIDAAQVVQSIGGWGFLATAVLGVVHAQLTFVPEKRTTKPRALPRDLRNIDGPTRPRASTSWFSPTVRPLVSPDRSGLRVGLGGRF